MSFQNFETFRCCVRRRYQSSTNSIENVINETSQNSVIGKWVQCNIKKSKIVSDKNIAADFPSNFLKNLGRSSAEVLTELAANMMKISGGALKKVQNLAVQLFLKTLKQLYLPFQL